MSLCHIGDCRAVMRRLIAEGVRVQMCCTSPPYFGLRDYGTAQWEGGDTECNHADAKRPIGNSPSCKSTLTTNNGKGPKEGDKFSAGSQFGYDRACVCGARRIDQQLGLEATPAEYVANMVEVFRLVRDLLADDGTLWLNLGDSYATGAGGVGECPGGGKQGESWKMRGVMTPPNRMPLPGLKPKDLCGIPWRVAFALQADGWYLRQEIIWSKPNPMPESVTDRCTKSHESLFLLAKRERYYYDAQAIAEPATHAGKVVTLGDKSLSKGQATGAGIAASGNGNADFVVVAAERNRRSVWTVPTEPYSGAHFAVFPSALIEPCIMAGSRVGDVVLDPFFGSGTTGQVAQDLGRQWIGIELQGDYESLQKRRTAQSALVFL